MRIQTVHPKAMPGSLVSLARGLAQRALFGRRFVENFKKHLQLLDVRGQWLEQQGRVVLILADRAETQLEWSAQFIKLTCEHFDAMDRAGWLAEAGDLAAQRKELLDGLARQLSASDALRAQIECVRESMRELEPPLPPSSGN